MDAEKRDKLVQDLARIADEQSEARLYGREHDHEQVHMDADQLLLDFIGDPEVEEAFQRIAKWYS